MKLSANMTELLLDCAEHEYMYVKWGSKWERTALALTRRGLVNLKPESRSNYEVTLTEAGKAWAIEHTGQLPE